MEVYSVLIARVYFSDGSGSKKRPAVVVKFDNKVVRTYRITSQYENKSEKIKRHYFEILDWYKSGLKKPSWIDTIDYYDIDHDSVEYRIIGKLTERDIDRLLAFLKEK